MSQDLFGILFGDPFAVMNTIDLVAFALVESSKAISEEFDLLCREVVSRLSAEHDLQLDHAVAP